MIRHLEIIPAYDLRHKDCGVHGCELFVYVRDSRGATSIMFFTNWYLPEVQKLFHIRPYSLFELQPRGASISYHSRVKIKGAKFHRKCDALDGRCWDAGGSFCRSHEFELPLLSGGSKGLFKALEAEHERFWREHGAAD